MNYFDSFINQTLQKVFLLICSEKGHDIYEDKRKSYIFINLIIIATTEFLENRFNQKDKIKGISTNYI